MEDFIFEKIPACLDLRRLRFSDNYLHFYPHINFCHFLFLALAKPTMMIQ